MIFSLINNQITFQSKNPRIKKADDIARRAKKEYPMLSERYANIYYNLDNKAISTKVDILCKKIGNTRSEYSNKVDTEHLIFNKKYKLLRSILRILKRTKVGNCDENATVAYAALCANGYTNSEKVALFYETQLFDKQHNKVLASAAEDFDHVFVITSMSNNLNDKKDIVVDNWLGFADSTSGAIRKFKAIYTDDDFKIAEEKNIKKIKNKKRVKHYRNIRNCEYRSKLVLCPYGLANYCNFGPATPKEAKKIKERFTNLII